MKILQIATPAQATFAAFAVKNKKGAWVVERLPVVFFGLIPVTDGPEGKPRHNDNTVEPLVFAGNSAIVASTKQGYLGIDVMATANAVPRDWSKELIAFIASVEAGPKPPAPPAADLGANNSGANL